MTDLPEVKLKAIPTFPADVTASSPLVLTKTGPSYALDFSVSALRTSLDPLYQPLTPDTLSPRVSLLESEVATLESAMSGGHVGFDTKAHMDAAVGSYAAGVVADCFDPDPSLAGIYIRQVTATWGTRVALLPAVQAAATSYALYSLPPTIGGVTGPVVLLRVNTTDWIIRTLIVNGKPGEYSEWLIKDIGVSIGTTHLFTMASISTNENGIRRIQSDYNIHGAVFEYAMDVGLMADPMINKPTGTWDYYGNGHGNVTMAGMAITMDGSTIEEHNLGGDFEVPIGVPVFGSSLVFNQGLNILLPKNGSVIGSISQQHTFDANGCLVTVAHTITAVGIGNQNSYSAMLPVSGCNRAQFGSNTALIINLFDNSQTANQGHQSVVRTWHTDRPDLLVEMILPNGVPGAPDGYTNVTTSDTFAINNPAYTKCYFNYRSGNSAVAAVNSSHATQYRVRKT